MNPNIEAQPTAVRRKPRLAFLLATGFGLGYIPRAPGTWGSLLGVGFSVYAVNVWVVLLTLAHSRSAGSHLLNNAAIAYFLSPLLLANIVVAVAGVYAASRVVAFTGALDPQFVVIDEISGQSLTFLLNASVMTLQTSSPAGRLALFWGLDRALNWKYLLAGFILFRVFDVWKPFPARQAESLPAGWGIMADDWVAGVCAALSLSLLRWLGW